ncbi:MAG: hypothetical protein K6C12_02515 [Oscillospiraceae bacterium]|nr:hypothetical protein [Oscillospiraceae bacterium]
MKEKMMQFMMGRNGNDSLNRFLLLADVLLLLIASLTKGAVSRLLTPLALVLIVLTYYRMFSRDVVRRSAENARYLQEKGRVLSSLRILRDRWQQRKDYKFFTCPACKTTLRVPKGRGRVKIVCRKCGNSFQGKT